MADTLPGMTIDVNLRLLHSKGGPRTYDLIILTAVLFHFTHLAKTLMWPHDGQRPRSLATATTNLAAKSGGRQFTFHPA
jgi:hypothetical protein